MEHISDHDLERFHLGTITDEAGLAVVEATVMVLSLRQTSHRHG
jgi:hypothetical protein